jgi:mannose-6-phosphate isomerase-like protein (cupin superfamily)
MYHALAATRQRASHFSGWRPPCKVRFFVRHNGEIVKYCNLMRSLQPPLKFCALTLFLCCALSAGEKERTVDPTFVHRNLNEATAQRSDLTAPGCRYRPLFGEGDSQRSVSASVARFGEVELDPDGKCASVEYTAEDQIYVVLDGSGTAAYVDELVSLRRYDYLYIPASVPHTLANRSSAPLRVIVMGFRTTGYPKASLPAHPLKANIDDVPTQSVSGHPLSAQYRLLMGDADSKRDRIAAGRVVTSLFVMEIAGGGTNFPHHHEREEEIYLVLSGRGDMVAGGGMDGIEGRHPAQSGDAYFFRLNCTVGYYSAPGVASKILAVRSWYPGMYVSRMQH